eukprot:TRINITY_DN2457_c0_g1_i1.p1 TRINITY_DN2457_c0_g1~~TRINITY_DN2457_c0_g1_i1.p1  ORF type:complete len:812 (-),score=231.26 TRINITY_DN2457_c0_g1_i1:35-2194(-)
MKNVVNLLYTIASTLPAESAVHRDKLVRFVSSGAIDKIKLTPAIAFLKKTGGAPLTDQQFEQGTGVGVNVTLEDVQRETQAYLKEINSQLTEQKYQYPTGKILAAIKERLPFADAKDIKDQVDAQLLALLGPRVNDGKKAAPKKTEVVKPKEKEEEKDTKELITFGTPQENTQNDPERLKEHLQRTGGKVMTRFPPEPNGYLHAGHAKSMNLNFGHATLNGGHTYLRFDDTNPEAEKLEYINSIIEDVQWLGHKPWKITYSSDYFGQLFDLAIELIKRDKAYVCHQTKEEMREYKQLAKDSPYRNRPIEESLRLFREMSQGRFKEGEAVLRFKMDMQSNNFALRDQVAYRIKYAPHPHVGDRWCVYPTYDYTHCIIDSLEDITHSLCTLEFEDRRASYYRLLDDLTMYKPFVFEYSRLNINYVVLSKRKLIKLVDKKYVNGWDDPRMPTIRGFRRRGYTPGGINDFCDRIGVTRSDGNTIDVGLLEQCIREDLDRIDTARSMAVLHPVRVNITNWTSDMPSSITAHLFPHRKDLNGPTRTVPFNNPLFIDQSDFRTEDIKGYKRLAPGCTVALLHAGFHLTCQSFETDAQGDVSVIHCTLNIKPVDKARGYIHWVTNPVTAQFRLYDRLFKSPSAGVPTKQEKATLTKEQIEQKWINDLNPQSLVVINGFLESSLADAKVGDRFQFERLGYFVKDADSTPSHPVWNRIVGLKEAKWDAK